MQIASVGDVNNFSWHFLFSFIRRESETLAQSANIRQDLSRWIGVCVFSGDDGKKVLGLEWCKSDVPIWIAE